jgi:hypothetical protein
MTQTKIVVGVALCALTSAARAAAPEVPAPIRVPAGAKLVETFHATGAQVYGCGATDGKYAWTLKRPDATLTDAKGVEAGKHGAGPSRTAAR